MKFFKTYRCPGCTCACQAMKAINMQRQTAKDKEQGPMENANIFSLLFFWWMNDTLKLGSKRPLQDEDLFPLQDEFKTEALVEKLEREWYKENDSCARKNKHPRLWKVMFRMFSHKKYLIFATVKLIHSVCNILLPVMVWLFLRSLSEGINVNQASTTLGIFGISVVTVVKGMSHHHAFFLGGIYGIQLKVSVIGMIYKKVFLAYFVITSLNLFKLKKYGSKVVCGKEH